MYCIAAAAVYVYNVYVGQQVYRLGRGASSFFFLIGLLTSSCHAEASFDLYDDDTNGPGSEPPPHHHTHRITSAMPWRRSALAAVTPSRRSVASGGGKPSFVCFSSQSRVLSM